MHCRAWRQLRLSHSTQIMKAEQRRIAKIFIDTLPGPAEAMQNKYWHADSMLSARKNTIIRLNNRKVRSILSNLVGEIGAMQSA